MGKREVDPSALYEVLLKCRYQFKMKAVIWLFLTKNYTKAELARSSGVSRQHVSRTINDFLQKNAQKLFTQ